MNGKKRQGADLIIEVICVCERAEPLTLDILKKKEDLGLKLNM
jgi:hypothetical protein